MNLWSKKNSIETSLIIEIGAASVGAALVLHEDQSLPFIISNARHSVHLDFEPSLENLESIAENSLKKVLNKVCTPNLSKLQQGPESLKIVVTLSSPFSLTDQETKFIRRIEDIILSFVGISEGILIEEFIFVLKKVLDLSFQDARSSTLINMTHEKMDFLVVKDRVPTTKLTLPFGSGHIARRIGQEMQLPIEIAHTYLSLFPLGVLVEEAGSMLDEILLSVEAEFKEIIATAFENKITEEDLPQMMFITGPKNHEKIYKTLFESIFPGKRAIVIGKDNRFTRELVSMNSTSKEDQKLSLLASFSGLVS